MGFFSYTLLASSGCVYPRRQRKWYVRQESIKQHVRVSRLRLITVAINQMDRPSRWKRTLVSQSITNIASTPATNQDDDLDFRHNFIGSHERLNAVRTFLRCRSETGNLCPNAIVATRATVWITDGWTTCILWGNPSVVNNHQNDCESLKSRVQDTFVYERSFRVEFNVSKASSRLREIRRHRRSKHKFRTWPG